MSEENLPTPGATGREHKTVPGKRIKHAYRRANTKLSLKQWLLKQNGHVGQWGQVWFKNKLR